VREESEDPKLTISQAADLTDVSEATLRERLNEVAARANGGLPALPSGRAELEPVSSREVAEPTASPEPGPKRDLTLDLVARLERQAAELAQLTTLANRAESLAQALSAEREDREALEGELEEARSELRSLKSHIGGLQARHHRRLGLETELVRTQAELAAAKAQLAETQTTWRDALSQKLKVGQSRRGGRSDEGKRQREALEADLVEVREALERAQQRIAELEERDAERASLQQQLAVAQRELRDAQAQLRELAGRQRRRALSLVAQRLGLGP
jgi:chromosome segregation ATPase